MSEDNQLQAAHLILGYEPLSCIYQDAGQALRVGNPRLARMDVSKPGFLTRQDLPSMVLPAQSQEIDKFQFAEERTLERLVEILDSETKSDRLSTAH